MNILFCADFKKYYGKKPIKVAYVPITKEDTDNPSFSHMNHDVSDGSGHWTRSNCGWLPKHFYDTDTGINDPDPVEFYLKFWEDDTFDDDLIESRWSTTQGGYGTKRPAWPPLYHQVIYYGGGNDKNMDIKISTWMSF